MSNTAIQSGFVTPDGQVFSTKKEAQNHLRAPMVLDALMKLTGKNKELSSWLQDNQEAIEVAFETGTIKRVTKSERKQLEKALEAIKAANEKAFAFIADNASAVAESFRWPKVQRMDEEQKTAAIAEKLGEVAEGNKDLVKFVTDNKDAIFACYATGVEKREVNPKAAAALAAYREKQAAKKAA